MRRIDGNGRDSGLKKGRYLFFGRFDLGPGFDGIMIRMDGSTVIPISLHKASTWRAMFQ